VNYFTGTGRQIKAERRKARVLFYGLSLIVLLYLFVSLVFGERGIITYFKLKKSHSILQHQIAELKRNNQLLQKEVNLLKKDSYSFIIEKKAREDLNMAKEDEYIFIFTEKGDKDK